MRVISKEYFRAKILILLQSFRTINSKSKALSTKLHIYYPTFVNNNTAAMVGNKRGRKRTRTVNNNLDLSVDEKRAKKIKSKCPKNFLALILAFLLNLLVNYWAWNNLSANTSNTNKAHSDDGHS